MFLLCQQVFYTETAPKTETKGNKIGHTDFIIETYFAFSKRNPYITLNLALNYLIKLTGRIKQNHYLIQRKVIIKSTYLGNTEKGTVTN